MGEVGESALHGHRDFHTPTIKNINGQRKEDHSNATIEAVNGFDEYEKVEAVNGNSEAGMVEAVNGLDEAGISEAVKEFVEAVIDGDEAGNEAVDEHHFNGEKTVMSSRDDQIFL
ncbi:hypothetical protein L2E82_30494 [Cichorium intybus]|uniref:Uncharacterized protein n=1 Tax=Cichorium intybus TaxID=13427 RepID=A0ACB9D0S5_CICIN|nr:hypothetical protein L2E82_30494 [Cichorium intybus]